MALKAACIWLVSAISLFGQASEQGAGTVEGTAVNAVTNAPVRKAVVTLRNDEHDYSYLATTDQAGHFVFTGVQPATYIIANIDAQGYRYLHSTRSKFFASMIKVGEGQHVSGITASLTPLGAIVGRVTDEDGEPIVGANVQALRYDYALERKTLTVVSSSATNDLGEYRLYDLPPDRYFVHVVKSPTIVPRIPNLHKLVQETGFADGFYPGVADVSQGSRIEVAPGAEVAGIDLRMHRSPMFHIRGGAAGSGGAQLIALPCGENRDINVLGSIRVDVQQDGRFDAGPLVPGVYCLDLRRSSLYALATVAIKDRDVEGVNVAEAAIRDVPGTIAMDGHPAGALAITWSAADSNRRGGMPVRLDGSFSLRLRPAAYHIVVSGLQPGFYLKSIQYGQDDASSGLIDLRADGSPLTIALGDDAGQISGTVQTDKGDPAANVAVSIVPRGPLAERLDLKKVGNTDQSGRFHIGGLAPGEYDVLAWEDYDPAFMRAHEFLSQFSGRATAVTVHSNGNESVQLKIVPDEDIQQARSRL